MNKKQEKDLKYAANNLSRAYENKNEPGVKAAHKIIRKRVTEIYTDKTDVETVLQVEKILNAEQANVLGKLPGVYEQIKELAGQVELGLSQYAKFSKAPENYVDIADGSRTGGGGKQFRDGLPRDPIRNTFAKFREQLLAELMHREGDLIPDRQETNILRLDAAIKAERLYLEKYLNSRKNEPEQKKQEHLQNFDKRMEKTIRKIREPEQEKQPEPPKHQEELPKR